MMAVATPTLPYTVAPSTRVSYGTTMKLRKYVENCMMYSMIVFFSRTPFLELRACLLSFKLMSFLSVYRRFFARNSARTMR